MMCESAARGVCDDIENAVRARAPGVAPARRLPGRRRELSVLLVCWRAAAAAAARDIERESHAQSAADDDGCIQHAPARGVCMYVYARGAPMMLDFFFQKGVLRGVWRGVRGFWE